MNVTTLNQNLHNVRNAPRTARDAFLLDAPQRPGRNALLMLDFLAPSFCDLMTRSVGENATFFDEAKRTNRQIYRERERRQLLPLARSTRGTPETRRPPLRRAQLYDALHRLDNPKTPRRPHTSRPRPLPHRPRLVLPAHQVPRKTITSIRKSSSTPLYATSGPTSSTSTSFQKLKAHPDPPHSFRLANDNKTHFLHNMLAGLALH